MRGVHAAKHIQRAGLLRADLRLALAHKQLGHAGIIGILCRAQVAQILKLTAVLRGL